ncbi:hypothetical protein WA158_006217 [Blastocystis sp. Blastoise]
MNSLYLLIFLFGIVNCDEVFYHRYTVSPSSEFSGTIDDVNALVPKFFEQRVIRFTANTTNLVYYTHNVDTSYVVWFEYIYHSIVDGNVDNVDTKYERTFKDENGAELQYISPVGAILFKIQNSEPFIVNVDVSITHEFSYNHVILLIVGFILLIAAYYISHSHLFLYASSATLTVLLSSCLLFYFIYKRLNINKKTVGLLSVLSSIGLGSFIKQLLTQTTTNYISQYYPYLIGYVVLTAIIGIVIMYLYMPDSKAKSLNVLNAFLAGIGFLLLCSASPSVTMSVIVAVSIVLFKCFSSLIIPFLNKQLVLLYWGFRYRFWKTKKVYKTIEEYEDEGYQMTIQQMNELIHKFAAHPELMNKLDPKTVNILQKMCQGEYSYNYYISQQENGWVDKEHQQITADIDDDDDAMHEITVTPATTNNSNNNSNNNSILSRRPDFKLYPQAN